MTESKEIAVNCQKSENIKSLDTMNGWSGSKKERRKLKRQKELEIMLKNLKEVSDLLNSEQDSRHINLKFI